MGIGLALYYYLPFFAKTPSAGGVYIEGYLARHQIEVDNAIIELTHTGLTQMVDGELKPNIAIDWHVSEDGKRYSFQIDERFEAQELAVALIESGQDWSNIAINTSENNELIFELKNAFAPLLTTLANPVFAYGSYRLEGRDDKQIVLVANTQAVRTPFIEKIIFRAFRDEVSLKRALLERRVDGALNISERLNGYHKHEVVLESKPILICNLLVTPCDDEAWRKQFFGGTRFEQEQEVTISAIDSKANRTLLEREIKSLEQNNIKVVLDWQDIEQLNSETIVARDYQLLLIGLDYGLDQDLYPFWHSTQSAFPGLNLSGINNHDLDQLTERIRVTVDEKKRLELRQQAKVLLEGLNIVKFFDKDSFSFLLDKHIKARIPQSNSVPSDRFKYVHEWYIYQAPAR